MEPPVGLVLNGLAPNRLAAVSGIPAAHAPKTTIEAMLLMLNRTKKMHSKRN
jgi:hypothetical protein